MKERRPDRGLVFGKEDGTPLGASKPPKTIKDALPGRENAKVDEGAL